MCDRNNTHSRDTRMSKVRTIVGGILLVVGMVVGVKGVQRLQLTPGDEIIKVLNLPRGWMSDKSEGYMLIGIAALCVGGGVMILAAAQHAR
jgi:hypothetical protein